MIEHQTFMISGYVNDLLDIKYIMQGIFQRKISVFDPNKEVFELIIEMFREQAETRGITLIYQQKKHNSNSLLNIDSSGRLPKL